MTYIHIHTYSEMITTVSLNIHDLIVTSFFSFRGLNIVRLSVGADSSLHTQRGSASSLGLLPDGVS